MQLPNWAGGIEPRLRRDVNDDGRHVQAISAQ